MSPSEQHLAVEHKDQAWFGNAPTLNGLCRAYNDPSAGEQWLMPQLYDLGEYAGVRGKMDAQQTRQLARLIKTNWGYLKTSELMLFFWGYKSGRYGTFFGSVDPMRIAEAMRESFLPERAAAIDRHENELRGLERAKWAQQAATPEQLAEIIRQHQKAKDNDSDNKTT